MKSIAVKGIIFAAFVCGFVLTANAQKLGGYKTVAVDDEQVVAATDFAVGNRVENNTEQEGLELVSIDKAETQTVAGINYRLCLTVGLDGEEQQVEAVVFKSLKGEYSLKSWTVKDCGE